MIYPDRVITTHNFINRFSTQERIAIIMLRSDIEVAYIEQGFLSLQELNTSDPRIIEAMSVLVSKSILTQERMDEILGGND